jgi:hypothetical protein
MTTTAGVGKGRTAVEPSANRETTAPAPCPLCAMRQRLLDLCGDQLLDLWERRDSAHGADEEA